MTNFRSSLLTRSKCGTQDRISQVIDRDHRVSCMLVACPDASLTSELAVLCVAWPSSSNRHSVKHLP